MHIVNVISRDKVAWSIYAHLHMYIATYSSKEVIRAPPSFGNNNEWFIVITFNLVQVSNWYK